MTTKQKNLLVMGGVALAYFLATRLGMSLAPAGRNGAPMWPPTGFALGAMCLFGFRVWPGVLAGAFMGAVTTPVLWGGSLAGLLVASLGLGVGNTLEVLAGAWLMERFAHGRAAFDQPSHVFRFTALAAMASTTIGPTLGLASLGLAGYEHWHDFSSLWYTWWFGDMVSVIVLTPAVVVWSTRRRPVFDGWRVAEIAGLLVVLAVACGLLFGGWVPGSIRTAPFGLLLIPTLVWPALRFGQRGTTGAVLVLAAFAMYGTLQGWGPFTVRDQNVSLLLLQEFIGVVAVMALVLAADVAQRQRADAWLRASEQRYRELFESNPQPMWVQDYETLRFLAVNQAAVQHYGYSREEFLQMHITEIRPLEDVPALLGALRQARSGAAFPRQWRHRKKDGALIEVEITRQNFFFDGRPAVMVLSTDITERKRSEKCAAVLCELGRRLSAADSARGAAREIANAADTLCGWDACLLELFLPGEENLLTVFCTDLVDGRRLELPAHRIPPSRLIVRVRDQGAQLILRPAPAQFGPDSFPSGDKSRPSASLMYVPVHADEKVVGVFSIQSYTPNAYTERDLSTLQALADHCGGALERIRMEDALRQSEERLRLALAGSKMGTFTRELSGEERFLWSPELEAMFGFTPGGFKGTLQEVMALVHPDDRQAVRQAVARAMKTKADFEVEFRFLPRGLGMGWMLIRGRAYFDGEDRPSHVEGVGIDITKRKLAEQEILRLNAQLEQRVGERTAQLEAVNKELEAFCYSVTHDLRAPLRSIRGFSEVLAERYAPQLDERGREFLRRTCESCQQMDSLIEDLLKLSRLGRSALARKPVDLSALAQSIAAELSRAEPKREVEWAIAPGLRARGDERLLRVVLDNLLRNAWKFTSKQARARLEVGVSTKGGQPAFFVRDNGAGFDPRYADKLFGVFQRLHSTSEFPGTGIGLATVQRIINRHGGQVWAEGALEQGATFYFTLPERADI